MKSIKIFKLGLIVFLAYVLAGCATSVYTGKADVDKAAFGPSKRFAVVSIASVKYFQGEQGFFQMFKSNDKIPGADTQLMLDKLKPKILKSLEHSHYIRLLSERRVLRSRAYHNVKEDERVMKVFLFSYDMNVAHHYKYISDPKKFAELARALGVDGVISVDMTFSVMSSKGGLSINGLSFGKKSYSASVAISALAYDKSGNVIWKDSTVKEAEPGDTKHIVLLDTSDMTATDFKKFQPSAIEIGGKAVDVLLARFNDTMTGKEVSAMQSMKD